MHINRKEEEEPEQQQTYQFITFFTEYQQYIYIHLLYFAWVDQRTLQCYIGQTALLGEVSGQYSSAIMAIQQLPATA